MQKDKETERKNWIKGQKATRKGTKKWGKLVKTKNIKSGLIFQKLGGVGEEELYARSADNQSRKE